MVEAESRTVLPAYTIEVGTEALAGPERNSAGGRPFLAAGQEWPECFCGERLALFFQLDIPEGLEPFGGEHLVVFHCRVHGEPVFPELVDGWHVNRYWEVPQQPYPGPFWRVLLQREVSPAADLEPSVRALPLTLRPFEDDVDEYGLGAQGFKVGGSPSWAQDPEYYRCACGAEMVCVCQVPDGWPFKVHPGLPEQPYRVYRDTYELFLGNEVYLMACSARCDPSALWPVTQH